MELEIALIVIGFLASKVSETIIEKITEKMYDKATGADSTIGNMKRDEFVEIISEAVGNDPAYNSVEEAQQEIEDLIFSLEDYYTPAVDKLGKYEKEIGKYDTEDLSSQEINLLNDDLQSIKDIELLQRRAVLEYDLVSGASTMKTLNWITELLDSRGVPNTDHYRIWLWRMAGNVWYLKSVITGNPYLEDEADKAFQLANDLEEWQDEEE